MENKEDDTFNSSTVLERIFERYVPHLDVIFSIKAFFWLTVTKGENNASAASSGLK